tara:strand:- start:12749 stop:13165 length:417 start_codon:yes stop_codon:yes gene_type:complete
MILISHRGNLNGKSDRENQPDYIEEALAQGFDVEIDVWDIFGSYFLGHDEPKYLVKKDFLKNDGLWCHAKNIQGLYSMLEDNIHCFWHQEDDVTLTSEGYMWTYPGKDLTKNSIAVLPDNKPDVEVAGVCSDFIVRLV